MRIRVYFEDTDCGQIVYHTSYIRYCERARSELFFTRNILPCEDNCGFVLSTMNAKFHNTAVLGDVLEVRTKLLKSRKTTILLDQKIFKVATAKPSRQGGQSNQEILIFSMEVLLAFVDVKLQKPRKIPQAFLDILQNL